MTLKLISLTRRHESVRGGTVLGSNVQSPLEVFLADFIYLFTTKRTSEKNESKCVAVKHYREQQERVFTFEEHLTN